MGWEAGQFPQTSRWSFHTGNELLYSAYPATIWGYLQQSRPLPRCLILLSWDVAVAVLH